MSTDLQETVIAPPVMVDPSKLGWPHMLPIEIALREKAPHQLCEAYKISREEWNAIRVNPVFVKAVEQAHADLSREGMGFKVKARMQAEALLTKSWDMIMCQDIEQVPAAVKADLIKHTMKWGGVDGSADKGGANIGTALQININLG